MRIKGKTNKMLKLSFHRRFTSVGINRGGGPPLR